MSKTIVRSYKVKIAGASLVLLVATAAMATGAQTPRLPIVFSTQTRVPLLYQLRTSCVAGIAQTSELFDQLEQKLSTQLTLVGACVA